MSIHRWTVADPARMSVVPAQEGDLVTYADHVAALAEARIEWEMSNGPAFDFARGYAAAQADTEDYRAPVKPIYVDSWDSMAVPFEDHVVAVQASHAAGMREALADFLTSLDDDDPVYERGHWQGLLDGIETGRVMAAHDVEQLGVWAVNPNSFIRLTDGTRLVRLNDAVKAARGDVDA